MNKYKIFSVSIILFVIFCFSCKTIPSEMQNISRNIADDGIKSVEQLVDFFIFKNPNSDKKRIERLATLYVKEASFEGINSDIAFIQMCLETGFLKFGGLVTADMHNYCGLGAIDKNNPGEIFPNEQMGVRAHIQHLHAYGSTATLKNELVDRRYKYVQPRGKAPSIFELAGTWAADKLYGEKLETLLCQLEKF